jgi:hypothetical protein
VMLMRMSKMYELRWTPLCALWNARLCHSDHLGGVFATGVHKGHHWSCLKTFPTTLWLQENTAILQGTSRRFFEN